jgi:hypothetical protein
LPAATGEFGSVCRRMLCSPWQVVQTGASALPLLRAAACTLPSYCAEISEWQAAHVSGMWALLTSALGSAPFCISWLP